MFKHMKIIVLSIALVLQLATCFTLELLVFQNRSVYQTTNENKTNKVILYKDSSTYKIKIQKNGETIEQKVLKTGYRNVKEATWMGEDYAIFTYVDEDYHTITLSFDFTKENASSNPSSFLDAVKKMEKEEKEKEQETLKKKDPIKTQTGISFKKNATIAVTFDYGNHWKDTGIDISETTFPNGDLRLSEDSYNLSPSFSYFYFLERGWLYYTYSTDEGTTWKTSDLKISGIEAVWFQAGMQENQPYFFMADKLNETMIFYQSSDQGATFTQYPSDLQKDKNLIYDTSYIKDDVMFVTYFQYGELYRSRDHGLHYEPIQIADLKNINQLLAPHLVDGKLEMVGIGTDKKEVIFVSEDDGSTWTRK